MTKANLKRFGRLVRSRREELGIQQEDLDRFGGPSSTTLSRLERGMGEPSAKTLRKLDAGLQWEPGSALRALQGGEPTPIAREVASPQTPPEFFRPSALDDSYEGPGLRPRSLNASLVMSARERQALAEVRNKLAGDSALTADENSLLTKFIENEELRTLHARIDWLPRAEQLEVSALVNDLHMQIEKRRIADGAHSLPDYAEPNPLPRDGVTPDQPEEEEEVYDTAVSGDETTQSDAQSQESQSQEAASFDDAQEPALGSGMGTVAPSLPDQDAAMDGSKDGDEGDDLRRGQV